MADQPLNSRLFDVDDDDAEDLAYKSILNGVITLAVTPSQAATQMDEWVTRESESKLARLKGREITEDEMARINLVAPNASRLVSMIIGCIAQVCSAYPSGSEVQNALLSFVKALDDVPKHQVPDLIYDDDGQPVLDQTTAMWPLSTDSTVYLAEKFRREADDLAYPFSDVETPGSESQIRWRNLQAFITPLTIQGLIDCSAISALSYILPSAPTYPDLEQRKGGGPRRIAADLAAASYWLVEDDARRWVYSRCQAREGGNSVWNMQNWVLWKEQMVVIAADERFTEETRALASSLLEKMNKEK